MKRFLTLFLAASAAFAMGAVPENRFPLPQIQQNRSLGEGAGRWHRTLIPHAVTAKLTVGKDGTLEISRKGKPGVSSWRINLTELPAGFYTVDTVVTGSAKAIIDIYVFDAQGKAKLVYLKRLTKAAGTQLCGTFEVPEGTVKVRFGFGVEDDGNASYKMPRLFRGLLAPETLPPRDGASHARKTPKDQLP